MMEIEGILRKMRVEPEDPVKYFLRLGEEELYLGKFLGKPVTLEYLGKIQCIRCGRETKKSFAQGYCYPCFISAPETEECVLRPELCRAQEGIARDMEYAKHHCLIEHVVYISVTSNLKVGVTRHTQVPVRWIDQGATAAIELARTPDRYTAGLMEVSLKQHMKDKTNWRKMLTGVSESEIDLAAEKVRISGFLPSELAGYVTSEQRVWEIHYPLSSYPEKIRSLNFDRDPVLQGTLTGIKGQYLVFDQLFVINIRKFGGYLVRFSSPGF